MSFFHHHGLTCGGAQKTPQVAHLFVINSCVESFFFSSGHSNTVRILIIIINEPRRVRYKVLWSPVFGFQI